LATGSLILRSFPRGDHEIVAQTPGEPRPSLRCSRPGTRDHGRVHTSTGNQRPKVCRAQGPKSGRRKDRRASVDRSQGGAGREGPGTGCPG
jgi:hypothetical protein